MYTSQHILYSVLLVFSRENFLRFICITTRASYPMCSAPRSCVQRR